jgi:hypothetical protein
LLELNIDSTTRKYGELAAQDPVLLKALLEKYLENNK